MNSVEVLLEAFGRIGGMIHGAVEGLSVDELTYRVDEGSNSIAWLAWHLTRIQDDHVAAVAGTEQVWLSGGWYERFGLPVEPRETGYGHRPEQVASVRVEGELLLAYYDTVEHETVRYLRSLSEEDLDRVVDTRWDPPVTLGVRLVSVVNDDVAHAGQAAFIRGVVSRR